MNSTFSNTFENEGSNKICVLLAVFLSPFLYRGFTTEYFKREGTISVDSALLQIKFKGEIIKGVLIFKIFMETSLYPYGFLDYCQLIIFSVPLVSLLVSIILGKGFPNILFIICMIYIYVVSLNITIIRKILIDLFSSP